MLSNLKQRIKGIILPFFYKKSIKRFLLFIMTGIIFYFVQNGFIENSLVKNKINEFTKNSVLIEETSEEKIYKVSRETSEYSSVYNGYIGRPGDILLTRDSPFEIPVVKQFISFFFGGHACIVSTNNLDGNPRSKVGNLVIESSGMGGESGVDIRENTWGYEKLQINIIGIRIKGYSDNDYNEVLNNAYKLRGKKYNYSFVFNKKNSYYCTDLVSRSFILKNVKLNDGFITSTNDIILSENSYIFFYQKVENGIKYIYY